MAVIKLNRTKTGVVPTALEDGELYIDQLNGKLYWADATGAIRFKSLASEEFPSGTKMLFQQSTAPVGWTKNTSLNDAALRVVSGSAGSGGSVGFAAAFAAGVKTGATAISVAQMPAHSHPATVNDAGHSHTINMRPQFSSFASGGGAVEGNQSQPNSTATSSAQTGITVSNASTGGGEGHDHSLPMAALKYVDVIVATKD